MECLFCKIGKKEIASQVVYEDDNVLAFLDIHPRTTAHTMVIPKMHIEGFLDASEDSLAAIMKAVLRVMKKIKRVYNPDAFTIGANVGRAAGQEIDHLHFHVMPRWHGDGGGSLQSVVVSPPKDDIKTVAEKLRMV